MYFPYHWLSINYKIFDPVFTAFKLYSGATSPISHGLICGSHSIAMEFFSSRSELSLKNIFIEITLPTKSEQLRGVDISSINSKASNIASATLLVSSVALSSYFNNPILANTIAYPLAAVIKIVAARIFLELEFRKPKQA